MCYRAVKNSGKRQLYSYSTVFSSIPEPSAKERNEWEVAQGNSASFYSLALNGI